MAAHKLLLVCLFLAPCLHASTTLSVIPSKDSFDSGLLANQNSNYGGAGALAVAGSAAGNTKGPADTFMTFDITSIISGFNSTYGVGNWTLTNASLQITEKTSPGNAIFNSNVSGNFEIRWITNDGFPQGTGNPGAPTTDGIAWGSSSNFPQSSYLTPGSDVSLGNSFNYTSTPSNSHEGFVLPLTDPNFIADLQTAGLVSFYLTAGTNSTAFTFNSTDYTGANPPFATSRPTLSLTAVPEPSRAMLLAAGLGLLGMRRRRGS